MKFITILLMAVILCFSLQAQQPDSKKYGLKGNVKSLSESGNSRHPNRAGGGFSAWAKSAIEKTVFDKTGRSVEYQKSDTTGALYYKIKYIYNIKDRNAQVQYFDKNDQPSSKEQWIYNDKNQKTEEQRLSKEGVLNYRYTYTYDGAGNMVMKTSYMGDGRMVDKTAYTYDTKKNVISETDEGTGGIQSIHKYSYDDKGNRTGDIRYNAKNEIEYRWVYVYDAQGNMTQLSQYKSDSDIEWSTGAWKYVYDKQNNWIKRTSLDPDGNELSITERVITYY